MRKFKFLIILLFTISFFLPSIVSAVECVKEADITCYEVTAFDRITKKATIPSAPSDLVLNSSEINALDGRAARGGTAIFEKHLVWVCKFTAAQIAAVGAVDTNAYAICDKSFNSDNTIAYQCYLGYGEPSPAVVKQVNTCNYGSGTSITIVLKKEGESCTAVGSLCSPSAGLECVDGKCKKTKTTVIEDMAVTQSSSSAAMYSGSAAATFGEGNFQCGTRKVNCDPKGWLANLSKECACCGTCSPDDILVVANKALEWLFGIVGALGLLMFVYGGAMWVMSRGDSGMIGKGKSALVNTAIGMIIMFASSAIIVALQTGIGIEDEYDMLVTPTGSYDYAGTASTSAAKEDASIKYGEIKLGAACQVLKSSKETQCVTGMYCYSKNSSTGVCLPRTPKAEREGGADCWVLPGGKTMCKSGNCEVTGKTTPEEGEQGKCETKKEVGQACMRLAGADSQCNKGLACYNESGKVNEEGICLPTSSSLLIKSVKGGEVCYKLKGSLSMCASGTCQTAKDSAIGTAGKCPVLKKYGESCAKDSDCVENGNCYNKICIPKNTRNLVYEASCYVLESTPNDCNNDFKCIPTAQQSTFHGESRPTGSVGKCLGYNTLSNGKFVNYAYECATGQELYSYGGSNFCVKKDFRDELKEEGMSCTSVSLEGLNTVKHDCEATNADNEDLSCMYGTCLVPDAQE